MSKYQIRSRNPRCKVFVGWHPGLATFFAQVIDRGREARSSNHRYALHVGVSPREITDLADLAARLKPHAYLSGETRAYLRADQEAAAS